RLPVSPRAHPVEQTVVLGAVLFEVQTQVEKRFFENPGVGQQERDEQPAYPPVPVEEGMDGLELDVREPRPDEDRERSLLVMEEALEVPHAVRDGVGWRRHEVRGARPAAADPVLRPTELAGLLPAPPSAGEELRVDLPDQPVREREVPLQAPEPVVERGDVVG